MNASSPNRRLSPRDTADVRAWLALAAVVAFFVVSGWIAAANIRSIRANNALVVRSQETVGILGDILSSIQDAETGQRGYLLTGNDRYLEPYRAAKALIPARLDAVRGYLTADEGQRARLGELSARVQDKLQELQETVDLRRTQGLDAALPVVNSDRGKAAMDDIRARLAALRATESELRAKRLADMESAYATALTSGIASAVVGLALTLLIAVLVRRSALARAEEAWLQKGRLELAAVMAGDPHVEDLGTTVLSFLAPFVGAEAGVLFTHADGRLRRLASVGMAPNAAPTDVAVGTSLLGRAVSERKVLVVREVPEDYFTIASGLGKGRPRQLVVVPGVVDGYVQGVLELGFFGDVAPAVITLLEQASPDIAIALRSAAYRAQLARLLEETRQQAQSLQTQEEELRVSNEELEEQAQALRASQGELEAQQAELEQTNVHLADQSQQMQAQRDELALANASIEAKAREVHKASQYKSEFLANMSHELRTPLNSALILSKLLADNTAGNLTDEQVKFARTIHTSGSDLLTLINDILDLSKIEAGHIEVRPEPLAIDGLLRDLEAMFSPLAQETGLDFSVGVTPDAPPVIESDRQRIEQVLKNLIANALKFTETGSVRVQVRPERGGLLAFDVIDTGIGIAPEQQARIFEAFQQADGSISRRFGGTGLGLSISRELARLLGGDIGLSSTENKGSTFTLRVAMHLGAVAPVRLAGATSPAPSPAPVLPAPRPVVMAPPVRAADVEGSARDDTSDGRRIILVIEDDPAFSEVVADQVTELGFRSMVAATAAEALALARRHMPQAIILDVGLPDQSGLYVLDTLKHDVRTRHIPIHVVSAADHSHAALSLGAMGYMVKPVTREDIVRVLDALEARLSQRPRRVLVVEDDTVQLDAIRQLLASADVETMGAGTAAECLAQLKKHTFDCMVLDLSLPDTSGFALLESLSNQDEYPFPPVIVYTGRDLSATEEARLRRYSSSIIIKGARSPERLLDEVTLFLHQVVNELPEPQQGMIRAARHRDAVLEGRRILLAEDDVRNVFALMNVLEPHGCQVSIARNGQEAVDMLSASGHDGRPAVDLVLMDVMMPVKDGLTAMREIRQNAQWSKLPIIALTAKAMPDDQQQCLDAGANDYMAKPIDVDKLLSLIRVWLTAG